MPMLPPLVPDLTEADRRSRTDRGSSMTARSLDARMARVQRRYASNYNLSYVHQAAKPPVLEPELRDPPASPEAPGQPAPRPAAARPAISDLPTSAATFARWRAIEAKLHLDRDGVGEALEPDGAVDAFLHDQPRVSPVRWRMGAVVRRPSRRALFGTTTVATLCILAVGGYHSWTASAFRDPAGLASSRLASIGNRTADRPPETGVVNSVAQPAWPPSSPIAAPAPAPAPVPALPPRQDAAAELLALRPALQPIGGLPSARAVTDVQPGSDSFVKPAEVEAQPAVLGTPSVITEPVAPPVSVGAATADLSKPGDVQMPPVSVSLLPVVGASAPDRLPASASAVSPASSVAVAVPPFPAAGAVITVTAKPVSERAGTPTPSRPTAVDSSTALASASPSSAAAPAVAAAPGDAAALPPGFTAQQMSSTLALVNQMALLVHDMHDENVRYRADVVTLTGRVQAKASDFEKRLRLAEARSSIVAAIETGREPAAVSGPVASDLGPAGGEARFPSKAATVPRSVRDYRIRRASYDYAELVDLSAPQDQAVPLEVVVGDRVPGVGRVTAIGVRGGAWVVRTDHGMIQ